MQIETFWQRFGGGERQILVKVEVGHYRWIVLFAKLNKRRNLTICICGIKVQIRYFATSGLVLV